MILSRAAIFLPSPLKPLMFKINSYAY